MRRFLGLLLLTSWLAPTALAFQTGARGAATPSAPRACALLTKDLIVAHSPRSKQSLDLTLSVPPPQTSFSPALAKLSIHAPSEARRSAGSTTSVAARRIAGVAW
jgi:hypothetical protein